ncbi:MAG: hypothetical protein GX221_06890 [Candidatus Riflebacteria bacterium]|nr:hypothetical protein [Candidatus Riflebacteria bacterium]
MEFNSGTSAAIFWSKVLISGGLLLLCFVLACKMMLPSPKATKKTVPAIISSDESADSAKAATDYLKADTSSAENLFSATNSSSKTPEIPVYREQYEIQYAYRRLESVNQMYKNGDYSRAARELDSLTAEVAAFTKPDPLLEMQTWFLASQVYIKSGHSSRAGRAKKKFMSSMNAMYEDSRFLEADKSGKELANLVDQLLVNPEKFKAGL